MNDERPSDDPADRGRNGAVDEDSSDDPRADARRDEPTSTDRPPGESAGHESGASTAGTGAGSVEPPTDPSGDGEHTEADRDPDDGLSDRAAFWISLAFGVALAIGSAAIVSGRAPFFEDLLRVRPTVEGGGIGAGWVVGNTEPMLEWLIVLVHFADVVMGIFILVIVFIHWAAFRRLAARMRPPGGTSREPDPAAATDGGSREPRSETTETGGGDSA